jgi:hypothetical protein
MKPAQDLTTLPRLSRREVLKWFAATAVALQLPDLALGAEATAPAAKGYGTDPDVSGYYKPGDFWPLTLTETQRRTVTALADTILPADHLGPAASTVRVPDFIDEWLSAPYPRQQSDRKTFLPGLKWLEDEALKRFQKGFARLSAAQQRAICEDICSSKRARPEFKSAASFFQRFRDLAAAAYYGTEPGWKALGYVGNVPLTHFDGPPQEVLDILGVEQTVK